MAEAKCILNYPLSGKIALVTGASSGIGEATAKLFAKLGASVALAGRNLENLNKVAEMCKQNASKDAKILAIPGDLSKTEDIKNTMETAIQHFGSLDILVNSAGIVIKGSIETSSLEDFDDVMNINVRSIFYLTQLAVPHLTKTQGNIVNVSSVNGMRSFPGVIAYCMSKSAIDQFTKCAAIELASKNIRVNSVNPGVIKTEIHKRGGMNNEEYEKFLEHSKTTHALGRVGEPDEVARTIAFLASSDSSFITGAQVPIDGGRHAMCPR